MKAFRIISTLFLAVLVMVSSTNFMVGMHFCMGEVKDVAFFTKADVCELEQNLPPCHRQMKAPCCEDKNIVHKGDNFKASAVHVHIAPPTSVEIEQPVILISEIIPSAPFARTYYYNYDPPLRSCDLTVEHKVFLI